jgi:hypothetical protein
VEHEISLTPVFSDVSIGLFAFLFFIRASTCLFFYRIFPFLCIAFLRFLVDKEMFFFFFFLLLLLFIGAVYLTSRRWKRRVIFGY